MSYRFMRTVLFFDLPTLTSEDKRNYRKFVKLLTINGFYRIQESVFVKMTLTPQAANSVINIIEKNKPPQGSIISLTITEKQFCNLHLYLGDMNSDVETSNEKVIEI